MRETESELDPERDGFLYNGESGILMPPEVLKRAHSGVKAVKEDPSPPARSFIEIPLTLPRPEVSEDFTRRRWEALARAPKPQPYVRPCERCKEACTHRYITAAGRMLYVCASHAAEAQQEGHEIYGPSLPQT